MARMPKYEKIRNQRLFRETKPAEKSKLVAFVNSGLFLWLLSAVAISIGGGVFSERQKCLLDSRTLIDRFSALDEELFFRDLYVRWVIRNAKKLTDAIETKLDYPNRHKEFKDTSSDELASMLKKIFRRAAPDENYKLEQKFPSSRFPAYAQNVLDTLLYGKDKLTLAEAVSKLNQNPLRTYPIQLEPNCGLKSVAYRMMAGDDYILWPIETPYAAEPDKEP